MAFFPIALLRPASSSSSSAAERKRMASALSSLRYGDNLSVVAISGATAVHCEAPHLPQHLLQLELLPAKLKSIAAVLFVASSSPVRSG